MQLECMSEQMNELSTILVQLNNLAQKSLIILTTLFHSQLNHFFYPNI